MQSVKKIIQTKTIATEESNFNTIAIATDDREIDLLLEDYKQLRTDGYKAWHAKCIKLLGCDKYRQLASEAKEGKNPPRYFTWLLNREIAH